MRGGEAKHGTDFEKVNCGSVDMPKTSYRAVFNYESQLCFFIVNYSSLITSSAIILQPFCVKSSKLD